MKNKKLNTNKQKMIKVFSSPLSPIFHYCSVSSFLDIISSAEIFLSHSQYSNDFLETKWIRSILSKCEKQLYLKYSHCHIYKLKRIMSVYKGSSYLACFSSQKDTLSQWREYADKGFGVSIGFDANKLEKHMPDNTRLNKVIYDEEEQICSVSDVLIKHVPHENIDILKYETEDLRKKMASDYCPPELSNYIEVLHEITNLKLSDIIANKNFKHDQTNHLVSCIKELIILAHLLKNYAFHEECEQRLCYFPSAIRNSESKSNKLKIGKLSHRHSERKIIPHYSLHFNEHKDIIKEIVLGPRCKLDEYSIRSLLKSLDYKNIVISQSKASYR